MRPKDDVKDKARRPSSSSSAPAKPGEVKTKPAPTAKTKAAKP